MEIWLGIWNEQLKSTKELFEKVTKKLYLKMKWSRREVRLQAIWWRNHILNYGCELQNKFL
jgi:hypothetical protein